MIDLVVEDAEGRAILVMVASGEWFDLGRPLDVLRAKVNNYATYALDGQLIADYPQLEGRSVEIRLRYPDLPDEPLAELVRTAERALRDQGVEFKLEIDPGLRG